MTRGDSGVDARFAALSDTVRALAERGSVRNYRKGTVLIEEGDRGDTLYVVLSGRVRVYSSNEAGREVSYGVYGAGEYLGEMSLDGGPRSASVITLEPTACSVVQREALQAYIAEQPAFAFELLAKLIRRVRAATLSTKQLALNDVYGRLKALLESHADVDTP
ncbi:MAG TPA: cyclic nucleotide-binding domain-containing protein, partial [Burkholderiaceae bacterium]